MVRLAILVLFSLVAFGALRRMSPVFRTRRAHLVFGAGLAAAAAGWAVPLALGYGLHGPLPGILPFRLFTAGWAVAVLVVIFLSAPVLFAQSALELRERWRARAARKVPVPAKPRSEAPPPAGVQRSGAEEEPVRLGRRDLLARVGAGVPLVAGGSSVLGVATGSLGFTVRELEVAVPGLPPALEGFRIGQLTDVHVGAFVGSEDVARAVALLDEHRVDVQVLTGDLIDDMNELTATFAALDSCRAPHGMVAVLGNHEHWRGLRRIRRAYDASAVKLLVDDSVRLEHRGARLRLVGVDYPLVERPRRERWMFHSAERAFRDVSSGETVVCLSHYPDFFPEAARRGAALTLAGHTHGGQVALLGKSAFWFAYEHMLGRYRRGDSQLYVSGGMGHWLPFRLGVPAEVAILTLRGAGQV